jgi:hypothetical protein
MLADDEAKHRRIFEDMQAELPAEMTDSGIIVVAVNSSPDAADKQPALVHRAAEAVL